MSNKTMKLIQNMKFMKQSEKLVNQQVNGKTLKLEMRNFGDAITQKEVKIETQNQISE